MSPAVAAHLPHYSVLCQTVATVALASAEARVEALTDERELADLAADSLATCKRRGWSTHWTERGAYLHLEASELIEAIRGKGTSTPAREAGDVLLVLMSLTQAYGVPWSEIVAAARAKVEEFRTKPRYAGEEFNPNVALGDAAGVAPEERDNGQ